MSTNAAAWWEEANHADRRPVLLARNRATAALRQWFAQRDFVEVETATLQVSPGNETHLHALRADFRAPDGEARRRYLHTSPEFAMKKLLAAGESRIFNLARVFRDREATRLHATEFTMLEWYRADATFDTVMNDAIVLARCVGESTGTDRLVYRDREVILSAEPEMLTVAEAFDRWAGLDVEALTGNRDGLARAADNAGVRTAGDDTWSDIFSRVLVEKIEPRLGEGRLTLLHDYPLSEAALARAKPGAPHLAERFELYACGVELANGFGELTDREEQRRRFAHAMDEKERLYGERYPIDEDFLAALDAMPEAAGVALGFDRLMMLATAAPSVHAVMWTPVDMQTP